MAARRSARSWSTWRARQSTSSTWSAVSNRTSTRAGELRSAPSGPDDWHRATGKRALAQTAAHWVVSPPLPGTSGPLSPRSPPWSTNRARIRGLSIVLGSHTPSASSRLFFFLLFDPPRTSKRTPPSAGRGDKEARTDSRIAGWMDSGSGVVMSNDSGAGAHRVRPAALAGVPSWKMTQAWERERKFSLAPRTRILSRCIKYIIMSTHNTHCYLG